MRVPGTKGALVLSFEEPGMFGATFASPLRLKNATDADLLAVRVEVVSATETSTNPAKGPKERAAPVAGEQAPEWPSVPKGSDSSAQLFRAGPLALTPDSNLVIVMGAVSGIAATGSFEVEGAARPRAIDTDVDGTVYVADESTKIVAVGPAGQKVTHPRGLPDVRHRPDEATCARFRAEGKTCRGAPDGTAWVIEGKEVSAFSSERKRLRSFAPGGEGPPVALAFGKDGRLYVATAGEEGRSGSIRVFRPF